MEVNFSKSYRFLSKETLVANPVPSGCTLKRKKWEWRQEVPKVIGEDFASKSPFLYPSCRDGAMLNHSGTLWWGAGNRMAATPHSL